MRTLLFIIFMITVSISYGQKTDCDLKLEILKNVFKTYEIKHYEDQKVFETKVWEKHAVIAFKYCYIIQFNEGITALAFNVYLSEDPKQYQYMIEEGIYNLMDVDDTNLFQGGDERLIQVIFYDRKNNKFLGKAKGFPIDKLTWIPEGMGDMTTLNTIKSFSKTDASNNTCILSIEECPDCLGDLNYVFKFHKGEILTSKGIDRCYESIYEKNNRLILKIITNCYENQYYDEPAQIEEELLFTW